MKTKDKVLNYNSIKVGDKIRIRFFERGGYWYDPSYLYHYCRVISKKSNYLVVDIYKNKKMLLSDSSINKRRETFSKGTINSTETLVTFLGTTFIYYKGDRYV